MNNNLVNNVLTAAAFAQKAVAACKDTDGDCCVDCHKMATYLVDSQCYACYLQDNTPTRTPKPWALAALMGFALPMAFAVFAAAVVYYGEPAVTNEHTTYLVQGLKHGLIFGTICGLVASVVEHVISEVK